MADVWDLAPTAGGNGVWDLAPPLGGSRPGQRQAQDLGDALLSGIQNSATGLAARGKLPSVELGEDAPWYHRLAAGGAGVLTDLPLSVVGGVAGGAAGSVAPGPGNLIGMGAGAFAAPMALREALIEAYSHNYALSWDGAWEIAKSALKGGAKGAVIGGVTAGAGGLAARAVGPAIASSIGTDITVQTGERAIGATAVGSELAALTATSAALEGRMPTWQDFMDNAVLLGGLKTAVHVAQGMRNIYAETGRTPEQVLADAQRNPALKGELVKSTGPDLPPSYKPLALDERIKAAVDADPRPEMIRATLAGDKTWEPVGESKLTADPVKYEYVTDRETAIGVMRSVSALYEREITAQTRGEVPNKQTALEALKLIASGEVIERTAGEASNAADIYARAHMLRGAANYAVGELKKLAATPDAEMTPAMKLSALASLERVAMLNAEFSGAAAEAGRALQIFHAIKRDPSFLGEAQGLIKLAERKGNLQDVAAMVATFKDPSQIARFARDYVQATTMEKVLEAWKAGLISGPQTQAANMIGNLTKWVVEVPESTIAASLFAIDKAAHGDPLTLAQWKARAFAPIYGLMYGAKESLHAAAEVWRGSGEHVEKADQFRGAIEGRAGEIVRLPFKALQVGDVLFRTPAERAQAHIMAVDRVTKEGLHSGTQEFNERVAAYTMTPELGLSVKDGNAVISRIQDAGAESVFAQRLGPRLEMMQLAMAGHWSQFIVPFFRTPANLVSWAVQHTPGLNLMSARWREDFAAGGERQARATARVMIGTGLAATAYTFAQNGTLTGGGLFDKEQSGTKRAAGWQPYSVLIGDKYYSYQRIEPVAKVLGLAADLVELSNSSKIDEDKAKAVALLVLMFGNATVSTTYLSGLSGAIQSLTDPERYGGNFLEQYATSLVPKIVGQTTTMTDPHKREVDGVLDAVQSQLPFLREKLLPKRDVWGEPVANDRWFDVMPVATSEASHDKVRTEAARLQVAIADAPRFLMEKGPFNPRDKRTEITSDQRDIFRQVAGKNAMTILSPIVNSQDWDRIPDFAKAEVFKHVAEGTRKQAQYAALPPDDAAREQLRQKIVDRVIKETQEAQEGKPSEQKRKGR